MQSTVDYGLTQGDHHPEVAWYDYEEEETEPKPCKDHNVRLKYVIKPPIVVPDNSSQRDSI